MRKKPIITRKKVEVELSFIGNRGIVEKPKNAFSGGAVAPIMGNNLSYSVNAETLDEEGF